MQLIWRLLLIIIFVSSNTVYSNELYELEGGASRRHFTQTQLQNSPLLQNSSPSVVVKAKLSEDREAIISATEYAESSPEHIQQLLADHNIQDADVLLSTDQERVTQAVINSVNKPQDKRLLRIIPIGKLASVGEKVASGFKKYYYNARDTLLGDRIGLTVLAITVGNDSMIWLHSTSLDAQQKTAMIMMNLVMAATFGLDRDLWGNINRPLKNKLIQIFDRFMPSQRINMVKTLSSQFISNMFLGMGIQLVRTGLLSLDHINTVVTTGDFWLTAMKLSGLVTLTTFAWSEMFATVDANSQPVAKTMLKRLSEMRGIIMCQLATVSMVLQPHIYGNSPIYTYVLHGAIGLIALANAQRIVNWLESNERVQRVYKKIETFEKFINSGIETLKDRNLTPDSNPNVRRTPPVNRNTPVIRTCRSLFAS